MAHIFDKSYYYIDFSNRDNLTDDQKKALEAIQQQFLPIERAAYLSDYLGANLITSDEYTTMTGIPMAL